jgi:septum site-determining protein MinC
MRLYLAKENSRGFMNDTSANRSQQAFRLKGTAPALTLLYMLTEDLDAIERQLSEHLRQMPQFFLYAPVVVDLTELGNARVDLPGLADLLRRHRLVPVAVRNPTDSQQVQAVSSGWAVLQSALSSTRRPGARLAGEAAGPTGRAPRASDSSAGELSQSDDGGAASEPPLPGLTVRTPVRSGQVIHAVGGDLVVLAPVSSGAEIIADGNIHVYAPLRGRALAGAQGNSDVSIFCLALEPEFLSIAGRYLMPDQISKQQWGKATRAHLDQEDLVITSL